MFWGELPLNPSTGLSSSSPYDDPKLMLHDTLPPQAVRREGPLPSADLEGQAGAPTGTDMENDAAAAERTQVPGTTEEGLTAEAGEVGTEGTADVVLDEPDGVEIIEGMEGLEGFEDFVGGEGDPTGAQEEGDLNAETLEDETTALEALDEPQTESEAVALLDGGREALPPAGGPADAPPSGPEVALSIPRLEEAAGQGLWLVVRKSERRIDVVSPPEPDGEVVATFEVNLGFAPEGDKVRQGDGKTPEGEFQVTARHPESRFYRAFLLSYPAEEDIERGLQDGLITSRQADRLLGAHVRGETPPFDTPLGGLIEIHGMRIEGQPTRGCVAISNREIDALWPHVRPGTRVTILP